MSKYSDPDKFEFIAKTSQSVINGEQVWSPETEHVTVRKCQDYIYEFGDDDVVAALSIDGLLDSHESVICMLAKYADGIRESMHEHERQILNNPNPEGRERYRRITAKLAILHFVAMFADELMAEAKKGPEHGA